MTTGSPAFEARFRAQAQKRSPFCLGLDPSSDLLCAYGLKDDSAGLKAFCEIVASASAEHVALVKPQSAYFERFGAEGMKILSDVVKLYQKAGALVLIDVKRGDIGSTLSAYADAYLGEGGFSADAMTAHAYLGFDALAPLFERADRTGSAVFVVVASSNPEGRALQDAKLSDGRSICESLADGVARINRQFPLSRPAGAVIGATRDDLDAEFFRRLDNALVLAPGIGAQGARLDDLPESLMGIRRNLIPTAARSVLAQGPDEKKLRAAVSEHCRAAQTLYRV